MRRFSSGACGTRCDIFLNITSYVWPLILSLDQLQCVANAWMTCGWARVGPCDDLSPQVQWYKNLVRRACLRQVRCCTLVDFPVYIPLDCIHPACREQDRGWHLIVSFWGISSGQGVCFAFLEPGRYEIENLNLVKNSAHQACRRFKRFAVCKYSKFL